MAVSTISPGVLTLHGSSDSNPKSSVPPNSAIAIRLNDTILKDVKKASSVEGGLQLLTGTVPKIQLGKRTIALSVSPELFRHELYTALTDASSDLHFSGLVGHRAELHSPSRKQSLGGPDVALAALQSSLASYEHEKQASQTNISTAVLAVPKNRWEANREQKQAQRRGLLRAHPASPSFNASATPRSQPALTSVPASEHAERLLAMRTPLLHLVAMRPLTRDAMLAKTHIPRTDIDDILHRIGKPENGKWSLTDKAYKELDPWKFQYASQEDRQMAIDNAIRAFDRLRIGKDEELWQILLPKQQRNKGVTLSRLHINRTSTPNPGASPLIQPPDSEIPASTATTPKVGSTTAGNGLAKRLFAKDHRKQRAAENAREKKRKETEAAKVASDNEGGKPVRKKQTTATNNPKYKSAELVHSSSEEDDGKREPKNRDVPSSSQPKADASGHKATSKAKPVTKSSKETTSKSPETDSASVQALKPKSNAKGAPKATKSSTKADPPSTNKHDSKVPAVGRNTPNGLSAPPAPSRSQLSPQKSDSKPSVPSPLGAARPRVASDVSDRGAVGVQRMRQGAETPKGLGITNGMRKRQDTVTSMESAVSALSPREKVNQEPKAITKKTSPASTLQAKPKPTMNGVASKQSSVTNGETPKPDIGVKRKAVDHSTTHESAPAPKHRKTESSHSSSDSRHNSNVSSNTPAPESGSTSSNHSADIADTITYNQGVKLTERFRNDLYPKYIKMFEEQEGIEKRGGQVPREERDRLWKMHRRLEQIKAEIKAASLREQVED